MTPPLYQRFLRRVRRRSTKESIPMDVVDAQLESTEWFTPTMAQHPLRRQQRVTLDDSIDEARVDQESPHEELERSWQAFRAGDSGLNFVIGPDHDASKSRSASPENKSLRQRLRACRHWVTRSKERKQKNSEVLSADQFRALILEDDDDGHDTESIILPHPRPESTNAVTSNADSQVSVSDDSPNTTMSDVDSSSPARKSLDEPVVIGKTVEGKGKGKGKDKVSESEDKVILSRYASVEDEETGSIKKANESNSDPDIVLNRCPTHATYHGDLEVGSSNEELDIVDNWFGDSESVVLKAESVTIKAVQSTSEANESNSDPEIVLDRCPTHAAYHGDMEVSSSDEELNIVDNWFGESESVVLQTGSGTIEVTKSTSETVGLNSDPVVARKRCPYHGVYHGESAGHSADEEDLDSEELVDDDDPEQDGSLSPTLWEVFNNHMALSCEGSIIDKSE